MMLTIFLSVLGAAWLVLAVITCIQETRETRYDGGCGG